MPDNINETNPIEHQNPFENPAADMDFLLEEVLEDEILPVIPLRGAVLFPGAMISFDLNKEQSLLALDDALEHNSNILLLTQKNAETEDPKIEDLYSVGVVTNILQALRMPSGGLARVISHGEGRAVIAEFTQSEPFIKAKIATLAEPANEENSKETEALLRLSRENFSDYVEMSGRVLSEAVHEISQCNVPGRAADIIGGHVSMKTEQLQSLLEERDGLIRLQKAVSFLTYELDLLKIQRGLYEKIKLNLDKNQRDYILREQLKAIHNELGDGDNVDDDLEVFREKMASAHLPEYVTQKLDKEIKRLKHSGGFAAEAFVLRDYIERVLDLPWHYKTKENMNLSHAEEVLEKDHYGLRKVKERVIEFLAVRQQTSALDAPIICLLGPPGVGKTSIAKSIARALNRKYVRMSLGGVRDEAEIRGHRKTYVGAMPGRMIDAMRQAGTLNPLILLDEIDKMTADFRGNPASALLEVLDSEQNVNFRDHYLELPFDLSDVLFICTANQLDGIPQPLIDRLEIIQLASYTEDEKIHIGMDFLLAKQLKKHGLRKNQLKFQNETYGALIRFYTREAGVRQLERAIAQICRKVVKILLTEEKKSVTVTPGNLETFMGNKKFRENKKNENAEVGICRGLAWTSVGGDTLSVEVNTMKGTGKFKLTGNIGKVMEESAHAAISYIRSRHEQLSIRKGFFKDTDIHIHIPEGATPKDGPSAGITMATAMVSALTDIPVSNQVAMTGEITIRGRVLPIGGLKEKILAAKNAGIQKVLLPWENESDLSEINQDVKEGLDLILVKTMDEVLSQALERV
ncbi:MAG: endopeptidase La [Clostridiales bacterium]|jgi:ATP-dependent Lon protease|nr:endopeptidase La [Clostridiales bacterium]